MKSLASKLLEKSFCLGRWGKKRKMNESDYGSLGNYVTQLVNQTYGSTLSEYLEESGIRDIRKAIRHLQNTLENIVSDNIPSDEFISKIVSEALREVNYKELAELYLDDLNS